MPTNSSFYGNGPDITSETVFDSASVKRPVVPPVAEPVTLPKRGRGRPRKEKNPAEVPNVKNPVAVGTLADILGSTVSQIPTVSDGTAVPTVVSKRPASEYHVVCESKVSELSLKVNELLKNGWVLHGSLATSGTGLFAQALTRST